MQLTQGAHKPSKCAHHVDPLQKNASFSSQRPNVSVLQLTWHTMTSLSLSCFSESTLATSLTDVATSADTVPPCKAESNIRSVFWSDLRAPCSSDRCTSNCCQAWDTFFRLANRWDTLCVGQKNKIQNSQLALTRGQRTLETVKKF
jgi:hypothetical protein